jgi:hypothetical protein
VIRFFTGYILSWPDGIMGAIPLDLHVEIIIISKKQLGSTKMNTSITIIGLIILALFLLPWVIISRSSKGTVKRLVKDLHSEASNNELIISDCDSWGESTIGIDEKKNKII